MKNDLPPIGTAASEEEYIAKCREYYNAKTNDIAFSVRMRIRQIAHKHHPTDGQAEDQLKTAISRLLRSRFKIKSLNFLLAADANEITAFLDGLEKLMEATE